MSHIIKKIVFPNPQQTLNKFYQRVKPIKMESMMEKSQEFVGSVAGITSYFIILDNVGFLRDRDPITFVIGSLFTIPVFPVAYLLGYSYPISIPAFGAYKLWKYCYSNQSSGLVNPQ